MPKKSLITATGDATGEWQDTQSPQIDPEIAGMPAEAPGIQTESGENALDSQTGLESAEFTADGLNLQEADRENTPDSQTGTETDTDLAGDMTSAIENRPASQIDLESSADEGTSGSDLIGLAAAVGGLLSMRYFKRRRDAYVYDDEDYE